MLALPAFLVLAAVVGAQMLPRPAATPPASAIPVAEISRYVGDTRIICGDVAGVRSPQTPRDSTYLDLDKPSPDQALAVVVQSGDRSKFSERFDRLIDRRRVCVEGKIDRVDGKLQLRVRDTEQFRYIGQPPRLSAFAAGIPNCGGGNTTRPEATTTAQPQYTADARRARIQGDVEVEVVIGVDGSTGDMRLRNSIDVIYGLDDEALKTIAQYRFKPATRDGQPTPCVTSLIVTFRLPAIFGA
jgi:TonB family protein